VKLTSKTLVSVYMAVWASGNMFDLINTVTLLWICWVLVWVSICRQISHDSQRDQLSLHRYVQ